MEQIHECRRMPRRIGNENSTVKQEEHTDDPLSSALLQLQRETDADMVLLGELLSTPFPRIRCIRSRLDQTWQPNFSYPLDSHPCQLVLAARAFQQSANALAQFPQAYLLIDNGLQAYAGLPVSLGEEGVDGVIVVMSRSGWKSPELLSQQLARAASGIGGRDGALVSAIQRARLLDAGSIIPPGFHSPK